MLREHDLEIRVRYQETDAQGVVHHANYLTWFESGRVELLRACGHSYRALEDDGLMLVVAEANLKYFLPARFDDLIRLTTRTLSTRGARIRHEYRLVRGDELLMTGTTSVACIDRNGRVRRLPDWLLLPGEASE